MCTMIAKQTAVNGSGKTGAGWFKVELASVSYDHPFDMPLEYTLNLDFTAQGSEPGKRVAVELDAESAYKLMNLMTEVMKQAETGGFVVK